MVGRQKLYALWCRLLGAPAALCLSVLASAAPSPLVWYGELLQKGLKGGAYIHHVLVVEQLKDGHVITHDLDPQEFAAGSYFDLVTGQETEFRFLLNQGADEVSTYHPPSSEEQLFAQMFRFTGADTIISAPLNNQRWGVYRPGVQGVARKEFIAKGPDKVTPEAVKNWLMEKIGYSGVVLAHKDGYLLVAMYKALDEGGSAMLVGDSHEALRIKSSQMEGAALLQRLDCNSSVCVFKIMIDAKNIYLPGSKVFF